MNQSQQLFGTPSERAAAKVRPVMTDWVQDFIRHSPFCVMASANADGHCDASPKGGHPGFVKVLSESSLLIPDVAGNKLFQSYENLESNPHTGLLFFIPGMNANVRVNGTVEVLRRGDDRFEQLSLEVYEPDEKAKVLQALLLTVREAYSHCPRSQAFSRLWNQETITANTRTPPISPWKAGY